MVAYRIRTWLSRHLAPDRAPALPEAARRSKPTESGWQRRRARQAAAFGIRRYPQRPGVWLRTTGDGEQRVYRVTEQNGVLYATVGMILPVAVPTRKLPGDWRLIERYDD